MNSRRSGQDWLDRVGRADAKPFKVSKLFTADESFPGVPVWWFEFPTTSVSGKSGDLHLLCATTPNGAEYHHFRVPMGFFLAHKDEIGRRKNGDLFSLYLCAEESRLFREIRGDGGVEFGPFKVDQSQE